MELGKPADMAIAVKISLLLCAAIYFAVGIFGYILFGDSLMSDMLVNFDQNSGSAISSLLNDVVRLSYALHLMLVFPLLNFSLRANIDEFLFPKKSPLVTDEKRFVALTLILLVCSYLAAIAIPNIWYFFQFIGSINFYCVPCLHLPICYCSQVLSLSLKMFFRQNESGSMGPKKVSLHDPSSLCRKFPSFIK